MPNKSTKIIAMEDMIKKYRPYNEQEARDKKLMLWYLQQFGGKALGRDCFSGHFTTSVFLFNKEHTKVLMCYHLIDKSWAWLGGHADGIADLKSVALREVEEESSLSCRLINDGNVAGLTVIPIGGHVKRGKFVSSHIHLDVAFVGEADETKALQIKADENSGLWWIKIDELEQKIEDKWKMENAYRKLIEQFK